MSMNQAGKIYITVAIENTQNMHHLSVSIVQILQTHRTNARYDLGCQCALHDTFIKCT